ncbi:MULTISPECIES: hypothetical protein [Mycobacteriaceae]|uniref:Uncharacterized protein n=1 Tax=Mycolicibacterium parafortuitum TaxID=39692 RepID=A0ACC6MJK4_MYCPF|nr:MULTISPECIES: hypothetical protein [Mycobacteriaceae]MDZ5087110.1 hypothetical protein [Mycolicibacterium parafortuitum]GFM19196.1 uncharacterized protein PO1_contig-045-53 [Mycobacterium sp. PO1]GFM24620.1 uncharacterized protein PO2_contig-045-10 [Mycobacterium sp. PO2]
MTKRRITVVVLALIGAVLGAAIGAVLGASSSRYVAMANVAFLPAPELSSEEASSFWEVLTRGQITRTAAIIYDDPRWLSEAAADAGVPRDDLTLAASALPDTTMLSVTVTAGSPDAAETALNTVLVTATPEVSSLAAPFFVKVLWPTENSSWAEPAPSRTQLAAAGALGGLLLGAGVGWFLQRRRPTAEMPGRHAGMPGRHSDGPHADAISGRPADEISGRPADEGPAASPSGDGHPAGAVRDS